MYGAYAAHAFGVPEFRDDGAGEPSPEEIALLEPFRDRLLPEVFGPAWVPPVSDGSGQDRKLLRSAGELLNAAGWTVKDGKRVNCQGRTAHRRIPARPSVRSSRITRPSSRTFSVLGIDANIRLVDPAQAEARQKDFDFDIAIARFIFPQIPGSSLRNYFSSEFGQDQGLQQSCRDIATRSSMRWSRRRSPRRRKATSTIACRALDRVLRSGRYWIPHWNKASHWIAYWDQFGYPADQAALCARRAGNLVVRRRPRPPNSIRRNSP